VPVQFDSNHQSQPILDNFMDVSGATNTVKIAPAEGDFSVRSSQIPFSRVRMTVPNKMFAF
jgi:hypothetical protein